MLKPTFVAGPIRNFQQEAKILELRISGELDCCTRHCFRDYHSKLDCMCGGPLPFNVEFNRLSISELADEISMSGAHRSSVNTKMDDGARYFKYWIDFGCENKGGPAANPSGVCLDFFLYAYEIDRVKWRCAFDLLRERELHNQKQDRLRLMFQKSHDQLTLISCLRNCLGTDFTLTVRILNEQSTEALKFLRLDEDSPIGHVREVLDRTPTFSRNSIFCRLLASEMTENAVWVRNAHQNPDDLVPYGLRNKKKRIRSDYIRALHDLFSSPDAMWQSVDDCHEPMHFPSLAQDLRLVEGSRCKNPMNAEHNVKRFTRAGTDCNLSLKCGQLVGEKRVSNCAVCASDARRSKAWNKHDARVKVGRLGLSDSVVTHQCMHAVGSYVAERMLEAEIQMRVGIPRLHTSHSPYSYLGGFLDMGVCELRMPRSMGPNRTVNVGDPSCALFVASSSRTEDNPNFVKILPLEPALKCAYFSRAERHAFQALDNFFLDLVIGVEDVIGNLARKFGEDLVPMINVVAAVRCSPLGRESSARVNRHFKNCVVRYTEWIEKAARKAGTHVVLQALYTVVPTPHNVSSFAPCAYQDMIQNAVLSKERRVPAKLEYGSFAELATELKKCTPRFTVSVCDLEEDVVQQQVVKPDWLNLCGAVRAIAITCEVQDVGSLEAALNSAAFPVTRLEFDRTVLGVDSRHFAEYAKALNSVIDELAFRGKKQGSSVFVQHVETIGAMPLTMNESSWATRARRVRPGGSFFEQIVHYSAVAPRTRFHLYTAEEVENPQGVDQLLLASEDMDAMDAMRDEVARKKDIVKRSRVCDAVPLCVCE